MSRRRRWLSMATATSEVQSPQRWWKYKQISTEMYKQFFIAYLTFTAINIVVTDVASTAVTATISDINLLHSRQH